MGYMNEKATEHFNLGFLFGSINSTGHLRGLALGVELGILFYLLSFHYTKLPLDWF